MQAVTQGLSQIFEVGKSDIYGADSGTGQLMYSPDLGVSWRLLGENKYSDIVILDTKSGSAYGLRSGALVRTANAFKTKAAMHVVDSNEFLLVGR